MKFEHDIANVLEKSNQLSIVALKMFEEFHLAKRIHACCFTESNECDSSKKLNELLGRFCFENECDLQ